MAEPPAPLGGSPLGEPVSNPLQDSGVTPTGPTPEYGRDKPMVGSGEEMQEPKPFSLDPTTKGAEGEKPTPMQLAGQWSDKQMNQNLGNLQNTYAKAQETLQDPTQVAKLTPEHTAALGKLADKLAPDMRTIGKTTGQPEGPGQTPIGTSPTLQKITQWLDGSQNVLSKASTFLQAKKKPSVGDMLKMQESVQRATERGELFSSIIGSSVSGIKTIMTTQLG